MKLPKARWWGRFAVGLLWTPVAAELYLRVFAPVPMLPRYIQAGPHGIRENMPTQTYRHQTPEYTVEIRTNAQGLRADTEFTLEKPEGVRRIAIMGDSFGMGYGVNLEDSSLAVMQGLLEEATGCEVEVLNFSVSGFGPTEEIIVLEKEALAFDPDLVIQYYCYNDPTDDVRTGLFALEDDELRRGSETYLPAVKTREFLFSFPLYRWLAGESHLYNLARDQAGTWAKQGLAMIRGWRSGGPAAPTPSPAETADAGPTPAEQLTLAVLDRMKSITETRGGEFLILSIPVRKARDQFLETFPLEHRGELAVVSPRARFLDANGEMLYWERSHGHWTPLGCRLVAETLTEAILEGDLLGTECREP